MLAGAQTGTGKPPGSPCPCCNAYSECAAGNNHRALCVNTLANWPHKLRSVRSYGKYYRCAVQWCLAASISIRKSANASWLGHSDCNAGRLLDHAQQRTVDLSRLRFFVLDEADRCWTWLHQRHSSHQKLLPNKRQNLMFSATYSMTSAS